MPLRRSRIALLLFGLRVQVFVEPAAGATGAYCDDCRQVVFRCMWEPFQQRRLGFQDARHGRNLAATRADHGSGSQAAASGIGAARGISQTDKAF